MSFRFHSKRLKLTTAALTASGTLSSTADVISDVHNSIEHSRPVSAPVPDLHAPLKRPSPVSAPAPTVNVVPVPALNWTIPGIPSVQGPLPVEEPYFVLYNLWAIEISWGTPPPEPQGPVAPDDSLPRVWHYEAPLLLFDRRCRKKEHLRAFDQNTGTRILGMRLAFLIINLHKMFWLLAPIPRLIAEAWCACRDASRPPRRIINRRQREYRWQHNRR